MDRGRVTLSISVVSPVYCADPETLRELHRRLSAVAEASDCDFEFVYVDDASPDSTWEVLTGIAAGDPRVTALRLARNVRQTRAIFAGTEVASGDAIVVMDSDLEDPPEFVPELIEAYRDGYDMVVATRDRAGSPAGRRVGSLAINLASRVVGLPVADVGSSFLILSREIEVGVRAELERTGVQLIMPTNFARSRNPTTRRVSAAASAPSSYPVAALFRIGVEFLARYAARRIAVPVALGATLAAGMARRPGHGRHTRAIFATGAIAGFVLAAVLVFLPARRRKDRGSPLYEVAERVGPARAR